MISRSPTRPSDARRLLDGEIFHPPGSGSGAHQSGFGCADRDFGVGPACGKPTGRGMLYCEWHTTQAAAEGRPTRR
jgi:hypothetical protein